MKHRTRGFTLVELLVVVAILALLAALLFPAFAAVKERARVTACQSNLKQLSGAFHLYLGDWDDTYPLPYTDTDGSSGIYPNKPAWRSRVRPYLKTLEVYRCPSNDVTERLQFAIEAYDNMEKEFPICYLMNGDAFKIDLMGEDFDTEPRTTSDIESPSDTILLTEGQGTGHSNSIASGVMLGSYPLEPGHYLREEMPPYGNSVFVHYTHDSRTNWLFCDGHVKLLRIVQTLKPQPLWYAAPTTDERLQRRRERDVNRVYNALPYRWR